MKSQWDCLLENLGEWQGSFTRLSPAGVELEDTPTIVTLEGLNQNQSIRQTIRRLAPAEEKVLEYSSLGRGVLLFEDGAFSQGSLQFSPIAEFGAELGFIAGTRRLRLVQLFRDRQLDRLTLIRERLAGTDAPERPPLTVDDLLGEWHGEAVTLYPDWRSPDTYPTSLRIERRGETQLHQELQFGDGRVITSAATIEGLVLRFEQGPQPVQVLLLPDGASATSPTTIQSGQPFFLEAGWLVQPNLRQRMIRRYDDRGEWTGLTLVTERRKVS